MGLDLQMSAWQVQTVIFRSENSIKNRFYSCLRKLVRKINLVQKQNKTRKEKLIK